MKITVYSDKDCVLRYNEKWPNIWEYNTPTYFDDLKKAKDESRPFEDQNYILGICMDHLFSGKIGIPKPDTFYTIEIPGKVEIGWECKINGKWMECLGGTEADIKNGFKRKVARIAEKEEETQSGLLLAVEALINLMEKQSMVTWMTPEYKELKNQFTITRNT